MSALGLLVAIRGMSQQGLLSDIEFVTFFFVTLATINFGAMVLCFRRKKFVLLFFVCEIVYLVLFAAQIFLFVYKAGHRSEPVDEPVAYAVTNGSLRLHTLFCILLVMIRSFVFIIQALIIFFRLKY